MANSRTKKTTINTLMGFSYEAVALVCGLILPRLLLSVFGSQYNGLTSSISQFISCISLLKAGIGGVSRAALYKPLAENDTDKMSEIIAATEDYLRKIALIFVGFVVIFASIYPLVINREFSWLFSSSLILIISITTFGQYYFGLAYQNFLIADQKTYLVYGIEIVTTVLNTLISALLIKLGFGIHIVRLGSSIVFLIHPIFLRYYAIKKYNLHKVSKVSEQMLKQKWDAVCQAVCEFVNDNTDVMVLTIFTTLSEVSVYTVYNYVIVSIRKLIQIFVSGFSAAFGNMYAKGEIKLMHENLGIFELVVFSLVSVIYSVAIVLICPFALLYTKDINDVNYFRPLFAFVFAMAAAWSCFRIPYYTIVTAVGHYRQTRNGAIVEAVLNITISIICVIKFGIVGVAVGTLIAAIFRSVQYAYYLSKNILKRSIWMFFGHVISTIAVIGIVAVVSVLIKQNIDSVFSWISYAFVYTLIAIVLTVVIDVIFYRKSFVLLVKKLRGMISRKKPA